MEDDFDLLDAWRRGDQGAGNELFNRHFDSICRFFANKSDSDVEDLVQMTFLATVESAENFRAQGSFRGFLFGVARNILRRHYRNKRLNRERYDPLQKSVADFSPTPSAIIAGKREQQVLLQALRQIPIDQQALLELYYWESLTARELAIIFEIPEGTVRGRIRRAKQLLEEQLNSLVKQPSLLESTVGNLDGWAESLRKFVGARPNGESDDEDPLA